MTDQTLNGDAAEHVSVVLASLAVDLGDGLELTLYELTTRQSFALHGRIAPMIESLVPAYAPGGPGVDVQAIVSAMNTHVDIAIELLALSARRPVAWVDSLPAAKGGALQIGFVRLHVPFFVQRLEIAYQAQAAQARLKDSAPSSPDLSATGTTGLH